MTGRRVSILRFLEKGSERLNSPDRGHRPADMALAFDSVHHNHCVSEPATRTAQKDGAEGNFKEQKRCTESPDCKPGEGEDHQGDESAAGDELPVASPHVDRKIFGFPRFRCHYERVSQGAIVDSAKKKVEEPLGACAGKAAQDGHDDGHEESEREGFGFSEFSQPVCSCGR